MARADVRGADVLWWLPALAWMGVIFYLSSRPGDTLPGRFSYEAHFVEYAVLSGFLILGLVRTTELDLADTILAAFLISIAYAATDELHQYFVPLRTMQFSDWLIDATGALFVGFLHWLRNRKRATV